MSIKVSIIVAQDTGGLIGNSKKPGGLPWPRHKEDMRHFVSKREGKVVIIGRVSYELIPPKYRPFRNSPTIVVSRTKDFSSEKNSAGQTTLMARGVKEAIDEAKSIATEMGVDEIIIAGGEQIYREALAYGLVDRMYITKIIGSFSGDARFPDVSSLPETWKEVARWSFGANPDNPHDMLFYVLEKKPH